MNRLVRPAWSIILWAVVVATAVSPAPRVVGSEEALTARRVIERIQERVGVPWQAETVDTFKAGDPAAAVTGIVTTMFPTVRILKAAADSGKNLIICHEPAFYDHFDRPVDLEKEGDPILADKKALIEKHGLIIWRFHDHWHLRRPDGILQGMVRVLGWEKRQDAARPEVFRFDRIRLDDLCRELKDRLGTDEVRVIGRSDQAVSTVAFLPGAEESLAQMRSLARSDVDATIIGETREWETAEYARDAVDEGRSKALIILGHVPSEEAGMEECARWLRTFVPEVPVEFIPSGAPYRVGK